MPRPVSVRTASGRVFRVTGRSPWQDRAPVREELFGVERLEQHARSLAVAQAVTKQPPRVPSLHARLDDNAAALLAAYRDSALELEHGRAAVPAAEWLLDNYHLVEEQVREARLDLPPGFYRQLPKLEGGPFGGYPRVFGIAWAYVAHTDSHFDADVLARFLAAYQTVQPLTIGELWAIAITLRIVLLENLRRLADQITRARGERDDADAFADRLLGPGDQRATLETDPRSRTEGSPTAPLSEIFAAQLVKRLRGQDPETTPALSWLSRRLEAQQSSIDLIVQHDHQRQAIANVTVRNVITSMRLMSDIGWADLFERVSLVDERLRRSGTFASMDFASRNLYRDAIEELGRGSPYSEIEIATRALSAGRTAATKTSDPVEAQRVTDPGYHLLGHGREAFEHVLGFVPPLGLRVQRWTIRGGIGGYVTSVLLVTAGVIALASLWFDQALPHTAILAALALIALIPFTDVATALVNRSIALNVGARPLPGLELLDGVPSALRTLIVVPTLLTSRAELQEQIEHLEVHHLSGAGGEVYLALLTDWADADTELVDGDLALLDFAVDAMAKLNARHAAGEVGPRFLLLHRRRVHSAGQDAWMGWERKRGKLHELNRLLRDATDTTFMDLHGTKPWVPPGVRYVVTLDADTRLPRDTATRLIGKMAHPLNRPRFDAGRQRVVDGYAILQPRVTPSLPLGRDGSIYQRIFAGPSGIDPYASAASDVYQDLLGEGSFTGKGIYDVDAFEAALAGRVPAETLLSHDLFEGSFARAGLASDVEVIDEFPSRYDVDAKRQHRWIRGDWQLLPWIWGHRDGPTGMPMVGRWKMLDNLRRSTIAPTTLAAFGLSALLPGAIARECVTLLLMVLVTPIFIRTVSSFWTRPKKVSLRNHLSTALDELKLSGLQLALLLVLLPDRAWRSGDAIVRTLVRVLVTHRHLLEWTTAAQSARGPRPDVVGFYRLMAGGTLLVLVYAIVALVFDPKSAPIVVPLAAIWLASPAFASWVSRPLPASRDVTLTDHDALKLRLIARRTWRFFETFVTPADHMLPPDNFQEVPRPTLAHRTSPTNIGLYLLSTVAARDFGWAGTGATVERIEATLASMRQLAKHRGHFFNWYDTGDQRVLEPPYVSAVDSGNLAGHLIVLANACASWRGEPVASQARAGVHDTLRLARDALRPFVSTEADHAKRISSALDDIERSIVDGAPFAGLIDATDRLIALEQALPSGSTSLDADDAALDLASWIVAIRTSIVEHAADRTRDATAFDDRLVAIAREARDVAMAMDFAFLLDDERKLLAIGYSLADNRLDPSCYDLLASEARLASLFAIAKGDVPTNHWFRLGRSATPVGYGSALISWSGSMFEYLMPSLVMRAPYGSLLEQTNRLVVERQRSYAASQSVPWGVSESAYNARDIDFTYQYSNFGVPGLGFKRGLADNLVIAPYATGLATMVDPHAALRNFAELATLGGLGRYGYYDALDFTRSRVPEGERVAVVRNYMAHHEGMTIVAIANALHDGAMRSRFHAEPMIVASELLLQERIPRDVAETEARVEEPKPADVAFAAEGSGVRRLPASTGGAPVTHLLSNDRYTVMLTTSGSGYSRWGDIAITRWHEDATRDAEGSFVFLRDVRSGAGATALWTTTAQPLRDPMVGADVAFAEDIATYTRRDGRLLTTMEVVVSGEDDAEVRRVSLHNRGRHAREIELTSYAELVLTTPSTDNAHPAFAKMFVQTRFLPTFDALIATRRRRTPDEPETWVAHFVVVEGRTRAPVQYETDRMRFLGRGRDPGSATAMRDGAPLSNTVGTVLDPVFALRCRVEVPPGAIVKASYWTVVASTEDALMDLIDRHHDRSAFDRARTFAWTQAQVKLRHLSIKADEAADFQRLAAPVLYNDARFRMPSGTILHGMGPQSGLWAQSISGDLPIVVMRIDDLDDMPQVHQLLRAHEYWRAKGLAADVVVVNERASSYVQDLQIAIETAERSSQSRPGLRGTRGTLYALRADLLSPQTHALLMAVARVVLVARRGPLSQQLLQLMKSSTLLTTRAQPLVAKARPVDRTKAIVDGLEFFNGTGGFADDGRSYVTVLDRSRTTPAPWINVIANARFGFQVSADGSGFTWAENSRDNQLSPWSNDPVGDPPGDALYVRDESGGQLFTATAQPIRDDGPYVARHGFGWSRFEHEAHDIALDLLQYVPLDDPVRISRLTLHNRSDRTRRLSVTSYGEWVLGTSRNVASPFIATEVDATGALFVRNAWGTAFPDRVAFSDLGAARTAWTTDRTEFLGRNGHMAAPAALAGGVVSSKPLTNTTGAGFDPCTAIQTVVELAPGARVEVVALLGQCATAEAARELIVRYRDTDLDAVLADVERHWTDLLGTVQVRTPDRAMDIMLNGWLLYQTLACRIFARSAFYQASGAYGFRDQLQDGMALTFAMPEQTRGHLLRAAGRQFVEGDVQHWWLPHSGQGVRTHISDDRVWLAYGVATYIVRTGDAAILDEPVAWLEGPALKPGEHDAFFKPMQSDDTATLFEHCARGLDQAIALTGQHGLPLMGTGDWNDGMNRVGQDGRGESVWLAWLLLKTIALFAPHAERRDHERLVRWQAHAESVRTSIESAAWDGEWYRRATFDDGTWLGSKNSDECRIDSIAQSWAVLSGAADPERARTAMASVDRHLIRRDDAIALLFEPPFDRTHHDPGYIKGYPPGLRENGGQYSHAAMWLIFAFARLGETDRAVELFALLNPLNHARTPQAADVYKVEPYVVAADVYSVAPHAGRGGWTWYTGSAAWMYRAGIEGILGIVREGDALRVEPRLPAAWPGFTATIRAGASRYAIEVRRAASDGTGAGARLDDAPLSATDGVLLLPLDDREHRVVIVV